MKEKIKTLRINGINTDYLISNTGRVFTKNKEKEKALQMDKGGYLKVNIQIFKITKRISVHRAVYESFVGDIPLGMQINHKNGDKTDNRVENLEVVTPYENTKHAWLTGLCKRQDRSGVKNPNHKGELNPAAIHTEEEAKMVYALLKETKLAHRQIAEKLNLDTKFVENISKGLWADVTGYKKEDIQRNHVFTKEEELILWYLYSKLKYRTGEIVDIMNINKNSINNKLSYIRKHKWAKMDKKIENPKVKKLVDGLIGLDTDQILKKYDNQVTTSPNSINNTNDDYQINEEEYEDEGMLELDLSNYREDDYQINEEDDDDGILELDLSTYREDDEPEYITNDESILVIGYK